MPIKGKSIMTDVLNTGHMSSIIDAANGLCSLDGSSKIPIANIPDSVVGQMEYQGVWDASTNSPSLSDGSGDKGHYYKVSVAGSTSLDGISEWKIGDMLVSNGVSWDKIDNTADVSSVVGESGAVTAAQVKTQLELESDYNNFSDALKSKLDGVEASATADQSGSEIKSLYEGESDTNAFTDADHSKLDAIEASATADMSGAEIKTAYEGEADTNAFTDSDHSKLDGIEAGAKDDQIGSEIKSLYEAENNTNALTDALLSKLNGIEASADVNPADTGSLSEGSNLYHTAQRARDSITFDKEVKTVSSGDVSNQYIDMLTEGKVDSMFVALKDGEVGLEGYHYTISVESSKTRITFAGPWASAGAAELVENDVLYCQYMKKNA